MHFCRCSKFDPTFGLKEIHSAPAMIFFDFFGSSRRELPKLPSQTCETECNLIHTTHRRQKGELWEKGDRGGRDSIRERSLNKRV